MVSAKAASHVELPRPLEAPGWIAAATEPAETGKRREVYRPTAMGLVFDPLNREPV